MKSSDKFFENFKISELRKGNQQTYELLVHQMYPSISYFIHQLVKDKQVSEEIAQDVFLKVWHKRQDFDNIYALKGFLYICAKNAGYNHLDKSKRRRKNEYDPSPPTIEPDYSHEIIKSELLRELTLAIDQLPDRCRKVIKMSYLEGKKSKEIAEVMETTESTVNNQKARGIQLLKKFLSSAHSGFFILIYFKIFY